MKKLLPIAMVALLFACNNSKKEKETTVTGDTSSTSTTNTTSNNNTTSTTPGAGTVSFSLNDTAHSLTGSVLVQTDKDKLSPGNDLLAMVTANSAAGAADETITVNFLFTPKPGTYPVVGIGISRTNEVYGGLLGGKPKITPYKINLTECTDLGDNGIGGHKWRISGSIDQEVTLDALDLMKMSPGHPDNIKLTRYQFSNLTYDDNMEQIMEKFKQN